MSSSYSNRAIEPFKLLQESFSQTGPIYLPLLLVTAPGMVISIVQRILVSTVGITPLYYGLGLISIVVSIITTGTVMTFVYRYLRERTIDLNGAFHKGLGRSSTVALGLIYFISIFVGPFLLIVKGIYPVVRVALLLASVALELGSSLDFISIFVGTFLLIIPGIYLLVVLAFTIYAIVSENCSAIDGLKYSMNLVKGRWWATFGSILVGFLCLLPLIFGSVKIATLSAVAAATNASDSTLLVASIGISLLTLLISPFLNMYYMKLYARLQDTALLNQ
jgi:hypothetical protein